VDIAVTGATGLIGGALTAALRGDGHRVRVVTRGTGTGTGGDTVRWDPAAGTIDADALAGVEAVVHLAGAGIGDKRWTAARKREILESRTKGTDLLARTLAGLDPRPAVLVSGSAIGIYGLRGDEELTEDSSVGADFLADLVQQWEQAAAPAVEAGIRVAYARTGLVLSGSGGLLDRMLPLFRAYVGGRLGSGRQWFSWVTIDDEIGALRHLVDTDGLSGPFNITAPHPVTNADFTAALGRVLGRPTAVPVPAFGPRLLFGREMADLTVFASQRVRSDKLVAHGYTFQHDDVEAGLRAVLDRPATEEAA
jgi:uncharacterized protein (TIGR01777 family)